MRALNGEPAIGRVVLLATAGSELTLGIREKTSPPRFHAIAA
ncbi:hypothetical protein [Oceanimonas smirnovii]